MRVNSIIAVLVSLGAADALSLKKAMDPFCLLGACIENKEDIKKAKEDELKADQEAKDLAKKAEELEAWHKEEAERQKAEEMEKKQKTEDEANFCTCGAWMCQLNDQSTCWKKCCDNQFGGPPPTRPPVADISTDKMMGVPGYTPADPTIGQQASWHPADWQPKGAVSIPFVGDIDATWLVDQVNNVIWPNHKKKR